jgi:hypothetical protein
MRAKTKDEMRSQALQATETLFRRIYDSAAADPRQWLGYARSLKLAASVLQPHFDSEPETGPPERGKGFKPTVGPIYLLLVGFAIENYAKAMSVIRNPIVVSNGKLIRLKRHDLLGLLADFEFALSPDEEELVERLEQFVIWAGRYPVPTKAENVTPRKRRQPGLGDYLIYTVRGDSNLCTVILDRLDQQVTAEMDIKRPGA